MTGLAGEVPSGVGRLRRITTSGRFLPEIDGLRFVAIAAVVMYHLRAYLLERGGPFTQTPRWDWTAAVAHGSYGVHLFFIISGFILALPFASRHLAGSAPVSLRAYFLRRLTRLEPPYVVSMLLFFALLVIYVGREASELLPHLAASLLYVHNVVFGGGSVINSVAWSLEVEVQFYVLAPFLAQLFAIRRRVLRRAVIVGLGAAAIALQAVFLGPDDPRLTKSLANHIQFFLFGFLLADVYLTDWKSAPATSRGWDALSIVGWPLLPLLWTAPAASRWIFPPLAFALYCAAFRGPLSRRLFSNQWLTGIGGMCYTIYLLHYPIISFLGRRTVAWRVSDSLSIELLWQFLLIAPVVLAVCTAYFLLVEKPCMHPDWPRRLSERLRRGILATPAT